MSNIIKVELLDYSDEKLQNFSRNVVQAISADTDIEAQLHEIESRDLSYRGDAVTLGTIALGLITSGSIVALLEVFKAMISREKTVKFVLENGQGQKIEIEAKNLSSEEFANTKNVVKSMFEQGKL